jgi:outer membrane protein assembly factor BamA
LSRLVGTCMLILAALAGAEAFAAEEESCVGLTIAQVAFPGCEEGTCAAAGIRHRLVLLTGLVDALWRDDSLAQARRRLERSGYFARVEPPQCARLGNRKVEASFAVKPNRYIRKTRIVGAKVIFESDLAKRIFLNAGAAFNPDEKESKERLERQVASLVSHVRQEGFDTATIRADTELVPPDLVDIIIRVEEGKISRVGRISVLVEEPPESEAAYRCHPLRKREIVRAAAIKRGDLFTATTARTVKRSLRTFLQKFGFLAPKIAVEFDPKTELVTLRIKVAACFSILVQERDEMLPFQEGYEPVTAPEVFEALPFRESGVFDRIEAQLGTESLLGYYRDRGHLFADVEMQFVDYRGKSGKWPHPLQGGIIYRVTKEPRSEIREIRLVGAKAFKTARLHELIETKPYDFFDTGGYLQAERLFADLDVLKGFYWRNGYYKMRYSLAVDTDDRTRVQMFREEDRTVYRYHFMDKSFDVIRPDHDSAIDIEIVIEEGEQSRIREVSIVGATALPAGKLVQGLPARPGGPFSDDLVKASIQAIESRYHRLGRTAKVEVRCTGKDPEALREQCRTRDLRSLSVALEFLVEEGPPRKVGEILVVGNLKTRRKVIVRDFPKEGALFDQERVDDAARRLRATGLFAAVRVSTIESENAAGGKGGGTAPGGPDRVDKVSLLVQVEEAKTRFAEVSFGFQKMAERGEDAEGGETTMTHGLSDILSTTISTTGSSTSGSAGNQSIYFPDVLLLIDLSFTDRNFMGSGKDLALPLKYGFSTRDPVRYAAFTPTFLDRRLFGSALSFRMTPLVVYDQALRYMDEFEYGIETELSFPMLKAAYVGIEAKLSRIAWKRPSEEEFQPQELQVSITPQVRFDWRDSPINPTSGVLLGTKLSYLNALVDSTTEVDGHSVVGGKQRDNFLKYEIQAQFYASVRRTVILAARIRFGDSIPLEGAGSHLPATHKFYLGGTSGMRGFPARGVLQYDGKGYPLTEERAVDGADKTAFSVKEGGDTMLNGNIELRFPVLRSAGIWAALFLDVGALADGLTELVAKSFRFSIGLGIRWLLGDQIPIRLDYGFVLDRRCNAVATQDPTQCLAEEDLGALDFGLLYTF